MQNVLGLTSTCLIDLAGLDLDRQIQIRRLRVDRAEGGGAWRRRRGWRRRTSTALTEITIPATISTWVGPGSELGRRRKRLGHRDKTPRTGEGRSTARGGRRRQRAIAVARRRKIEGTEGAWCRSPCGGAPVTRGRRGEAAEKRVDDGPSSCGAPMAAAVSGLGFAREGGCGSKRV